MSDHDYAISLLEAKLQGLRQQIKRDKEFILENKMPSYNPITKAAICEAAQHCAELESSISLLKGGQ